MINYLLTSTLFLGLCYAFYYWVLRREQSFQFNRFFLLGSLLISFILPLISFEALSLPKISVQDELPSYQLETLYVSAQTKAQSIFDLKSVLFGVYLSGLIFMSIRFGKQLTKLYSIIRQNMKVARRDHTLVKVKGEIATSSFFNYLIWNQDEIISKEDKQRIMLHEMVHIKEKHSYDIILLEILKIIFWFNPLLFLYQKSLATIHEYLADRQVAKTTGQQDYVKLLARQAVRKFELQTVNYFAKSQTLKRINMMNSKNQKISAIKLVLTLPLMAAMVFLAACQDEESLTEPKQENEQNTIENIAIEDGKAKSNTEDEVFNLVQDQPKPKEEMAGFYKYIGENLNYPSAPKEANIEARTFVQFTINKEGKFTDLEVLKVSLHKDGETIEDSNNYSNAFEKASLKVMKDYQGTWIPGKKDGKNVNTRMVLPFTFKL